MPEVIHGEGTERDCTISAVFSGFPSVVTIHGNMVELARQFREPAGSYGWLAARLETFTLKRTAEVFCISGLTDADLRAESPSMLVADSAHQWSHSSAFADADF